MIKFGLLIFILVAGPHDDTIVNPGTPNNTTDYYVKLIKKETRRAFEYVLPTDASEFQTTSPKLLNYGTYDYIIVGAGSAGSVIASRLTEVPTIKVLLLEAGGNETEFSDIPRYASYLQGLEFNWNFNTTPQTNTCVGMVNQQCTIPRGRGLGGTSIINFMMHVRGNKLDYDKWSKNGNEGWAYKEVLRYFIKSENFTIKGDDKYHGKSGYLNVQYANTTQNPQFDAFIKANIELGRKVVDYNGKQQLGVSEIQFNIRDGRRVSVGKAYLTPAMGRANLRVLTKAFATKILIKPFIKKAEGVIFTYNGKLVLAKARKEVIVSAGTIGSPQLLMQSGIGPKEHLSDLNIPIKKALSVGNNYQGHPTYFALHFVTNYVAPVKTLRQNVEEYLQGFGALTLAGGVKGIGFFQTKFTKVPGYPDIELIFIPSNNTDGFEQRAFQYTNLCYNAIWNRINPQRTFTILVVLLHPKSRGTLKLRSNNPFEYPEINPNFLSDADGEDMETLFDGIQLALDIVNTNAFRKLNTSLMVAPHPACINYEYLSEDYWHCQIRQLTSHIHDPVGTCKMGPASDIDAVVNNQLKVYGIENLRVADASIIPESTSGNTNAVAVMIGEKVSDMIKHDELLYERTDHN